MTKLIPVIMGIVVTLGGLYYLWLSILWYFAIPSTAAGNYNSGVVALNVLGPLVITISGLILIPQIANLLSIKILKNDKQRIIIFVILLIVGILLMGLNPITSSNYGLVK